MAINRYQNVSYENVKLLVMSNLSADTLLDHDFLWPHEKAEIPFGEVRGTHLLRGMDVAKVQSPQLFPHLSSDCKPIVTKCPRCSDEDET